MNNFVINEKIWKIEYVDKYSAKLRRSDGGYAIGVANNNYKIISISNELLNKPFLLNKVVCHEITHTFIFELGIEMSLEAEEKVCNMVSDYGYDILKIADRICKELSYDDRNFVGIC